METDSENAQVLPANQQNDLQYRRTSDSTADLSAKLRPKVENCSLSDQRLSKSTRTDNLKSENSGRNNDQNMPGHKFIDMDASDIRPMDAATPSEKIDRLSSEKATSDGRAKPSSLDSLGTRVDENDARSCAAHGCQTASKNAAEPLSQNSSTVSDRIKRSEEGSGKASQASTLEEKVQPASAFFGNIAKASATFYRAAVKRAQRPDTSTESVSRGDVGGTSKGKSSSGSKPFSQPSSASGVGTNAAMEKARQNEEKCRQLADVVDAHLSNVNGAKAGFVDIRLVKPTVEQIRKVVNEEIIPFLTSVGRESDYTAKLYLTLRDFESSKEEEIREMEQFLVAAKMNLAEAQGDLMRLKHDLAIVKRQVADPAKQAARNRARLRTKLKTLEENYAVALATKQSVESKAEIRQQELTAETAILKKVEADLKNMEGDWA